MPILFIIKALVLRHNTITFLFRVLNDKVVRVVLNVFFSETDESFNKGQFIAQFNKSIRRNFVPDYFSGVARNFDFGDVFVDLITMTSLK